MQIKFSSTILGKNTDVIKKILRSALDAVDPVKCVRRNLEIQGDNILFSKIRINLSNVRKIYVIGFGKAVLPMAIGTEKVLGDNIAAGFIIGKTIDASLVGCLAEKYQIVSGGHPIPSKESVRSAKGLVEFLSRTQNGDLVICLISGGGSALCTLPVEEICLSDMQSTTNLLLSCGAPINEFNTIRKHLDQIKGGGLLDFINPAQFVTLIMSDVIGDQISMIASGPTVEYSKSFKDVKKILQKYRIEEKLPTTVRDFIEKGVKGSLKAVLKKNSKSHQDTKNIVIGNLDFAIQEAAKTATEYGFQTKIITKQLGGEAREQGVNLAKHLIDFKKLNKNLTKPVCFIAGGETTVTLQGSGKGGRNQELALAAAIELNQMADCAIITFATDGEDGPTDAAGGIVNGETLAKGEKIGLYATEFLKNNDSYSYLKALDSLITTGSTGTNVNDIVFLFSF